MILIDERRLTNGIIEVIGEAYGLKYDHKNFDSNTYQEHIHSVVEHLTPYLVTIESDVEKCDICK